MIKIEVDFGEDNTWCVSADVDSLGVEVPPEVGPTIKRIRVSCGVFREGEDSMLPPAKQKIEGWLCVYADGHGEFRRHNDPLFSERGLDKVAYLAISIPYEEGEGL